MYSGDRTNDCSKSNRVDIRRMKSFKRLNKKILDRRRVLTILPTLEDCETIMSLISTDSDESLVLLVEGFSDKDIERFCDSYPDIVIFERKKSFRSAEEAVWTFIDEFSDEKGEIFFWRVLDESLGTYSAKLLRNLTQEVAQVSVPRVDRLDVVGGNKGRRFKNIGRLVSKTESSYTPEVVHGSLRTSLVLSKDVITINHECFCEGANYFVRMYKYIAMEVDFCGKMSFLIKRYWIPLLVSPIRYIVHLRRPRVYIYYLCLEMLGAGMSIYALVEKNILGRLHY